MSTLATSITTRLDRHLAEGDYESAAYLAQIAVNVHLAGLMSTPIPERVAPAHSPAVELTLGLDAIDRAIQRGRDDQREDEMLADFEREAVRA